MVLDEGSLLVDHVRAGHAAPPQGSRPVLWLAAWITRASWVFSIPSAAVCRLFSNAGTRARGTASVMRVGRELEEGEL